MEWSAIPPKRLGAGPQGGGGGGVGVGVGGGLGLGRLGEHAVEQDAAADRAGDLAVGFGELGQGGCFGGGRWRGWRVRGGV